MDLVQKAIISLWCRIVDRVLRTAFPLIALWFNSSSGKGCRTGLLHQLGSQTTGNFHCGTLPCGKARIRLLLLPFRINGRKPLPERRLSNVLKRLKHGDILIATELSRLGRNLLEVMSILEHCLEKGCKIWTLKENYRLGGDIQSKVLAFAFSLASEIERQLISERTKQSLQRLRDEGKHLGRPYGKGYQKLEKNHDKIKQLLSENVSKAEIARNIGSSWITVHRYIKHNIH